MLRQDIFTYMHSFDQYFAELSDLGLPPGEYPTSIEIEGVAGPFEFVEAVEVEREGHAYPGVIYKNKTGTTVKLFND